MLAPSLCADNYFLFVGWAAKGDGETASAVSSPPFESPVLPRPEGTQFPLDSFVGSAVIRPNCEGRRPSRSYALTTLTVHFSTRLSAPTVREVFARSWNGIFRNSTVSTQGRELCLHSILKNILAFCGQKRAFQCDRAAVVFVQVNTGGARSVARGASPLAK